MTRKVKGYVLASPDDCLPPHGLDMQSDRDANKVKHLAEEFAKNGFDENEPALVGYPIDGKIQLLSGTHRHLAAKIAEIQLPTTLWLRSDVERAWGTDEWNKLIEDTPVKDLENMSLEDGHKISENERVNLKTDMV
jgi:hypothetical protein